MRTHKRHNIAMRAGRLVFALTLVLLVGCARIPLEAVELSQEVGNGINLQNENILLLISAWEKLGYDLVDTKWKEIYAESTSEYNAQSQKTKDDLEREASKDVNIGALASLIREELKEKIAEQAKSMRKTVEKNVQAIKAGNSSITHLLASANSVEQTRALVFNKVEGLLSIKIPEFNKIIEEK